MIAFQWNKNNKLKKKKKKNIRIKLEQLVNSETWSRTVNAHWRGSILDHVYVNDASLISNLHHVDSIIGDQQLYSQHEKNHWRQLLKPFDLLLQYFSNFLKHEFLTQKSYPDLHHSQRGVWNLPHEFHLYLIAYIYIMQDYNHGYSHQTIEEVAWLSLQFLFAKTIFNYVFGQKCIRNES